MSCAKLLPFSMNFLKNLLKDNFFLILSIILASGLRLIWLDKVPSAISGDELTYILTAKYMALNWSDAIGSWNPLSIFIFHYPHQIQAEISYFLIFPFLKFFAMNIISVKFIFAILSIATVPLIYFITYEFFGKKTAVIASFIAAINPWSIFIGRTSFEVVPEIFFALLSLYVLLKAQGWKTLWSIPILAALFYSHISVKVIFLPLVFLMLIFIYLQNKRQNLKQYLIIATFCLALTLLFVLSIKTNPAFTRTSELISINDPVISKIVNQTRNLTIKNPLSYILVNKYTVTLNILITKFLKTFSFDYLFLTGDTFYGLYNHGLFYAVDVLFLISGFVFSFAKKRKVFYFLVAFLLISVVPQLIHTTELSNFAPHISLLFPVFIIFIAYGIKNISEFKMSRLNLVIISGIYLVSLLYFINIYFYQFSLKENFDFKARVLSNYITRIDKNKRVIINTINPVDNFKKYIFYTNALSKKSAGVISNSLQNHSYILNNVTFVDCNKTDFSNSVTIVDHDCGITETGFSSVSISRLSDGGSSYEVYNDNVCNNFMLNFYTDNIKLSDLSVEQLSKERFCKTYITRIN